MKKNLKIKALAAFVCVFALCAALAGCVSGGNGGGDNGASNFQGDWVLSGGTSQGEEIDQAGLDGMKALGMNVYIQLNEDGSAVLSLFGSEMTGTWAPKTATTADITLQGDTEEVKLESDELVLEADGDSLRFKRGEIPAESSETQPDAEQSATPEA